MSGSNVTLTNVILSYPHLDAPWAFKEGDVKKYQATAIFTQESNLDAAGAAIQAAIVEKWPDENTRPTNIIQPWGQAKDGIYKDFYTINAKDEKHQPDVVGLDRNPIIDKRQIFAGCKVHMNVRFYGTTSGGSPRVAAGLDPVMVVDNSDAMPKLSQGGMSVDDAFADIPGAPPATAPNPGATNPAANASAAGPAPTGAPAAQNNVPPGLQS